MLALLLSSSSLSYSFPRLPDKDPSSSCTLKRILGGTVQLRLNSSLGPNIQEIEWNWDSEDDEKPQLLVSWRPNTPNPDWYDLEEKRKHRFNVTEMAFLSIRNLTLEMSGLYTAKIKFHSENPGRKSLDSVYTVRYGTVSQAGIPTTTLSKVS